MYAKPAEPTDGPLTYEELQLATRNRGMPLEALRYDLTPTGLHYLLIHFDIPAVDPRSWRLTDRRRGGAGRSSWTLDELRSMPRRQRAGDAGMCRQRPGAPHATADEPAVAVRGDRHRRMDRHAAVAAARARRACARTRSRSSSPAPTAACRASIEQDYQRSLTVDEVRGPR